MWFREGVGARKVGSSCEKSMDSSSSSSSDSSDNELDEETKRSVKNLANQLLKKMKNDGLIAELQGAHRNDGGLKQQQQTEEKVQYGICSRTTSSRPNTGITGSASQPTMCSGISEYHKKRAEEALKDSCLNPLIEESSQTHKESRSERKKRKKGERSSWTSKGWGLMKPKENPTDEEKMDLMLLKMRSTIDPRQHYKHTDIKTPKYFQVGKIIDSPADFHHRLPNKKRKRTMVEELMADMEFRKQNKKKYLEVVETKKKRQAAYHGKPPKNIKAKKKIHK